MSVIKKLENLTKNNSVNTFILCLIVFVLINFIAAIIGYAVDGLIAYLFSNIAIIIYSLFAPNATPPTFAILSPLAIPTMGSLTPGIVIMSIIYIISPLITAIVAGRIGETKIISFGSWFLLSIISAIICIFMMFIAIPYTPMMVLMIEITFTTRAKPREIYAAVIGLTILGGIINGFFYGAIALLVNKS